MLTKNKYLIAFLLILLLFFVINLFNSNNNEQNLVNEFLKQKTKIENDSIKLKPDLSNIDYVKIKLSVMAEIDQLIVNKLLECEVQTSSECKDLKNHEEKIIHNNTIELKKMMAIYGWFPITQFGEKTATDAWLIIQHTDDIDLQHRVLFILSHFVDRKEASPEHYALLYDRVALKYQKLKIYQRYGTQFNAKENGTQKIQPYEGTFRNVIENRKRLGLMPIDDYINLMKSLYHTEILIN